MVRAMRKPSTPQQALAWYWQAMNDKALHLPIEAEFETPHCGWFQTRVVRGGPPVPARIWIEQELCPDTGELLSDEVMRCEIAGQLRDPYESWHYLFREPIDEAQYRYLMARGEYARNFAPDEPAANPFKALDWLHVPTPTFREEKLT